MVRILIADDHLLFRQVIREVIAREPDLEVVAEAGDGQEAARIRILNSEKKSTYQNKKKSKRDLPLSQREQEVLNLVRQGQRNREIARVLRISEGTVHKHLQNIFEKLNAHNRAEAIYRAKA